MYKIIHNDKVIDVIKRPNYIRFLTSGIAMTDQTSAHGIVGSDGQALYGFAQVKGQNLPIVDIVKITEDDYNRLSKLLEIGQIVSADESALAEAKQNKINSLSTQCKSKITAGFTIELSDGKQYNFKLTTEDQLNLMLIESSLAAGETSFVYHATNQPCQIFNKDDMTKVVKAFRKHTMYHTTYFNAAKQYIKSLTDIEEVNLFSYGTDIADTVENIVLRQILKNGGC